jgi:hypothetical protein
MGIMAMRSSVSEVIWNIRKSVHGLSIDPENTSKQYYLKINAAKKKTVQEQ